jgi:hypothetical protein
MIYDPRRYCPLDLVSTISFTLRVTKVTRFHRMESYIGDTRGPSLRDPSYLSQIQIVRRAVIQ